MNELLPIIKRIISIAILIIVCLILQISVFSRIRLGGVIPNLMVVITSSFGFMRGKKSGMLVGFFCGILLDCLGGFMFGTFALIYMLLGYINGFFRRVFYGDDILMPLIMIGTSDFIYGLAMYLCLFLSRGRKDIVFYLFHVILPEVVYTVVVSLILYFVIYRMCQWFDDNERKRERNFV